MTIKNSLVHSIIVYDREFKIKPFLTFLCVLYKYFDDIL